MMAVRSYLQATLDCTHTMVTHRVGYHYDVFNKKSLGIENKVLIPAEGKGGKKDGSFPSLGRGGGGVGVFTWVLLKKIAATFKILEVKRVCTKSEALLLTWVDKQKLKKNKTVVAAYVLHILFLF